VTLQRALITVCAPMLIGAARESRKQFSPMWASRPIETPGSSLTLASI
jgi:hypothetical protein